MQSERGMQRRGRTSCSTSIFFANRLDGAVVGLPESAKSIEPAYNGLPSSVRLHKLACSGLASSVRSRKLTKSNWDAGGLIELG